MNFAIINDECTAISEFTISGKHPNTREAWNQTFWSNFFPPVAFAPDNSGVPSHAKIWGSLISGWLSLSRYDKNNLKKQFGQCVGAYENSLGNVLKNNLKKKFGLWWAKQWVDKWKIRSIRCFDHRTQHVILQLVADCLQQNYHWFWSCVNWLILSSRRS